MFNNKFYKQIDVVAMGSRLGPALANIFMCSFGNKWLKDCPHSLKSLFYSLSPVFGMLMTYLYCFPLWIKQEKLRSIYLPNIPAKLFIRERN